MTGVKSKTIQDILLKKGSSSSEQKRPSALSPEAQSEKEAFAAILGMKINQAAEGSGVKISGHAMKRIEERNLDIDSGEFLKLREALDRLKIKGGKDSLVITNKAAYIVDVDKDTVVTAIDKDNMAENVFTKIDSTVFLN